MGGLNIRLLTVADCGTYIRIRTPSFNFFLLRSSASPPLFFTSAISLLPFLFFQFSSSRHYFIFFFFFSPCFSSSFSIRLRLLLIHIPCSLPCVQQHVHADCIRTAKVLLYGTCAGSLVNGVGIFPSWLRAAVPNSTFTTDFDMAIITNTSWSTYDLVRCFQNDLSLQLKRKREKKQNFFNFFSFFFLLSFLFCFAPP